MKPLDLSPPDLSIVIPCYNEANCLPELHARVKAVAEKVAPGSHEIIFVNDGSRDESWPIMQQLAKNDPALVAVNLSRNHGHQLALTAGLDLSSGKRILILDADLQDPPELLPDMMAVMTDDKADVVYAVRRKREGETIFKKATASLFYRLLARLTDVEIPLDTGDFRLMSRRALDAFLSLPEQARFIRGMVAWIGFKQVPFPYDRAERYSGETHYPLSKMLRLAFDAITGFSTAPLRWASHAGLALVGIAFLLLLYTLWGWWSGSAIQGWTSMMFVIVLLGAAQMFVLGMIGEYLGRLFIEVKRRPLYLVSEIAGRPGGKHRLGHVAGDHGGEIDFTEEVKGELSPPRKPRAASARVRQDDAPVQTEFQIGD